MSGTITIVTRRLYDFDRYELISMVRTSIEIRQSTKDRLKDLGKKEDTYDDIVQRLLQDYEKNASTK
jgi:hypothetical protein